MSGAAPPKTAPHPMRLIAGLRVQDVIARALREVMKVLYKAVSKGAVKKNTAARKVARLSQRLHRTHAGATAVSAAQ